MQQFAAGMRVNVIISGPGAYQAKETAAVTRLAGNEVFIDDLELPFDAVTGNYSNNGHLGFSMKIDRLVA